MDIYNVKLSNHEYSALVNDINLKSSLITAMMHPNNPGYQFELLINSKIHRSCKSYKVQELFTSRMKNSTNFSRNKGRPMFITSNTTTRKGSSYFLANRIQNLKQCSRDFGKRKSISTFKGTNNKSISCLLASVILGMAVCSTKRES